MMTTAKTNRSATWKYALVLPILIGLIFFFSCKESQVNQDTTTETPTKIKSTPISDPGTYSDVEMENVYKVAEEMPRFPGCESIISKREKEDCAKTKMLEYIYKNLKYPQEAIKAGLEGQCVVRFIVNTDGNIENIKIVRDIGGGCGQAVLNVISGMNEMQEKWISGKQGTKLVKVLYTLPVRFKLEGESKSIGNVERKAENTHPELVQKIDIGRKDQLLHQKVNDSKVAFNVQNDKSLKFTNPINENQEKGKRLCFIDGIETDFDLLKNTTYTADSIMIMTPESAIAKYGEKAKYGSIEFFNAKFSSKN